LRRSLDEIQFFPQVEVGEMRGANASFRLVQSLLDLTREEPVPDEQMDRAKHAIDLGQIISELS
jgi:hypothetical protein